MTTTLRPLALHALGIALGYADAQTREVGGNNFGDQIEWFQRATGGIAGESWCADFVYACLLKSYCQIHSILTGVTDHDNRVIMLANVHKFSAETGIPRTGYCPSVMAAAVDQGRWKPDTFAPAPGDLVLYDFKGQGEPHHVEFIRSATVDTVSTVGGNTSSGVVGSQADGDGVFRRVRSRSHVFGFVHF